MNWLPVNGKQPIVYYLQMPTKYAVFGKGNNIVGHREGIMPLPYTDAMLARRLERGADVPPDWSPQVFTITPVAEEPTKAKVAA